MNIARAALLAAAGGAAVLTAPAGLVPVAAAAQDRHADAGLEALLPASLDGIALVRESQRGDELSQHSAAFDRMLARLGRAPGDFTVASAYAASGLSAEIGAWRIRDVAGDALLPDFVTAVKELSTTPITVVDELVAGRRVTRIGDPGQLTRGPLYVLASGDALLFVQTPDARLAASAVAGFRR